MTVRVESSGFWVAPKLYAVSLCVFYDALPDFLNAQPVSRKSGFRGATQYSPQNSFAEHMMLSCLVFNLP